MRNSKLKNKLKIGLTLGLLLLLLNSGIAYAQVNISTLTYPGQKIGNTWNLSDLLSGGPTGSGFKLIDFVFFIAGIVFFFSLLSAAWEYLLSTGDAKKITSATQRFLNAFTGIVVVLGSFVIVRIVLSVLGIIGF